MDTKKRNHRIALTLLLAGLIFCFMLITIGLSALIGYICIKTHIISSDITLTRIVMFMALNCLVLGTIIVFSASKFPLIPVNKIINKMNMLAAGDYSARLHVKGIFANYPTVCEVTRCFNKMAEELQSTEMLRNDFINNFSHEFKTPIVSIAGFAKLLRRGNLTPEQQSEYLAIIEEESLRLSAMATNVLNMTKYENRAILTDITLYNLSEQLRGCILSLEGKWTKKNIEFNLLFEEYNIRANKDMLRQVWINLIDNAIKFSPDFGIVEISVKEAEKSISVTVKNSGEEIPADRMDKLFNKFYQADESHSGEGNGIGLSVVKNVVDLHGGTVEALSEKGINSFTVTLPKKK